MPFRQARPITLRDQDLLAAPLESIRPVPLYVLLAQRNAWHRSTSSRYAGASGLFSAAEAAKGAAESLRKAGTWFLIRQVPGLAIRGGEQQVIATEFHSYAPYGAWRSERGSASLRLGTPLGAVISTLDARGAWRGTISEHSFIAGASEFQIDSKPPKTWNTWTSRARGSDYDMDWSVRRDSFYSPAGVVAVRRAFIRVNGPDVVGERERTMAPLPEPDYAKLLLDFNFGC